MRRSRSLSRSVSTRCPNSTPWPAAWPPPSRTVAFGRVTGSRSCRPIGPNSSSRCGPSGGWVHPRSCSARRGSAPRWSTRSALTKPGYAVGDHPVLAESMPMLSLDERDNTAESDLSQRRRRSPTRCFVFSSGTTGMPKAVRHTHASFAVGGAALAQRAGLVVGGSHADHDAAVAHPRTAQHRDGARDGHLDPVAPPVRHRRDAAAHRVRPDHHRNGCGANRSSTGSASGSRDATTCRRCAM